MLICPNNKTFIKVECLLVKNSKCIHFLNYYYLLKEKK